ncbi:MAG: sulfatase/phosphatase domain-containing protein [Anditalea sp.]
MQGEDLTQLFGKQQVPAWRQRFFYEHHYSHKGKIPQTEGVIEDQYKYLRYLDPEPDYEVLYDVKEDPHEVENLADNPAYQTILEELRNHWTYFKKNLQ